MISKAVYYVWIRAKNWTIHAVADMGRTGNFWSRKPYYEKNLTIWVLNIRSVARLAYLKSGLHHSFVYDIDYHIDLKSLEKRIFSEGLFADEPKQSPQREGITEEQITKGRLLKRGGRRKKQ